MSNDYELSFSTYCSPSWGNVRYPSSASSSHADGWAYIYTQDEEYVSRLAFYHDVEIKRGFEWLKYTGQTLEEFEF